MAVTVATLRARVEADLTPFNRSMNEGEKHLHHMKKEMQEFIPITMRLSSAFSSMGRDFRVMVASAAASFVKDGVGKMVKSASELGDSMAKVDTIFKASSESVKKWSQDTDKALGLSQQKALDTVGTIGQLYQNMGIAEKASAQMSTKLVALAVDLAALNNIGTDEAMERIKRGVRGSAEALDELGLSFNANMVKQKAYQLGLAKQGEALTEASKAQAIYALMMQQGAKVSGQFARESETLAAQTKMLEAELQNLAADIGKDLVPVARDLIKAFRDEMLPHLRAFGEWTVRVSKDIPTVVSELGKMIDPLGIVGGIAQRAADSFKALGESFALFMHSMAMDASAMGKMQQFLQDAGVLSSAAAELRGKSPGGFTFIPGDTAAAAKRYGDMPEFASNADYAKVFERAARRAREQADSAMASARVVRQMEAAQGKGNDWYYGRGQTGGGLPDLGTPTPTPQPTGTGKGKGRRGRSTFNAPGLDSNLTIGAFLPFGDFDSLIERGRAMYLEYLAFLEERGRKAVSLVGGVTEQISGLISTGIGQIFNDHTVKMQERGKKALAITSEAATAATAALTGSVTAMWETANKEAERHRKISEDFMRDIEQARRKQVSNQQGESERKSEIDTFFTDFTRTARQSSRELLRSILGGRGRDRADVFKEFFEGMKNAFVDAILNSPLERLKKVFEPIADNFGKAMQEAMVGAVKIAQSGVGVMLGQVYQLLSTLNRKRGLNFGALLGGAAAWALLGPASIPFGINAGSSLWQGDIGGAATSAAVHYAGGGFNTGGGPGPNEYAGNSGWGQSRAQDTGSRGSGRAVEFNVNIGQQVINDRADAKRLAAEFDMRLEAAIRSAVR